MPSPVPLDHLDVVPDPAEVHRRIAATSRTQRLLRRLLRLALIAQRERDAASRSATPPVASNTGEATRVC